MQRTTSRETSGGPWTYSRRRGSRREVHRPRAGDEGAVARSVDLAQATREPS
jgi:hypothetical protein